MRRHGERHGVHGAGLGTVDVGVALWAAGGAALARARGVHGTVHSGHVVTVDSDSGDLAS